MGAVGTATLDFGVFPGSTEASVAVTGQATIAGTSRVDAFLRLADSADHSADEHRIENMRLRSGDIVAGTGFTIHGHSDDLQYGTWNVDWVWV